MRRAVAQGIGPAKAEREAQAARGGSLAGQGRTAGGEQNATPLTEHVRRGNAGGCQEFCV